MRKIIATDLDRTLIPNGENKANKGAIKKFANELKKHKNIIFVYSTGRRLTLIKQAMKKYNLPEPQYCLSLLGTVIFEYKNKKFIELPEWRHIVSQDWHGRDRRYVSELLCHIGELEEQSEANMNSFKQSYNISLDYDVERVVARIHKALKKAGIKYSVIKSVDVNRHLGMIDVVPEKATKIAALMHIARKIKVKKENILYCGDSGNDVLPITSGVKAVLVKNASDHVEERVRKHIKKEPSLKKKIFFPQGKFMGMNGNYAGGIIEGAYHFGFFK